MNVSISKPNLERVIPLPFKCDSVTIDNDQLTKYGLSENDMVLSVEQLLVKYSKKQYLDNQIIHTSQGFAYINIYVKM